MIEYGIAFSHGLLLAFGLILPLGVQNVFIFQQGAVQPKFSQTLPAVISAALCDTALILAAVFGVSVAVLEFRLLKLLLFVGGIVFLLYMGWITWHSKIALLDDQTETNLSTRRQILFAISVSLLNPHAILDTIGVIGTSSLTYSGESLTAYTLACIIVSWMWFFGLAMVGRVVRQVDRSGALLVHMNRLSALIMWGSAIYLATKF